MSERLVLGVSCWGSPALKRTAPLNRLPNCRRLYLSPYDLSPSYKDVHNKYSVRYFLNLVLVDEEDRRYFKQQVRLAALAWACMGSEGI